MFQMCVIFLAASIIEIVLANTNHPDVPQVICSNSGEVIPLCEICDGVLNCSSREDECNSMCTSKCLSD